MDTPHMRPSRVLAKLRAGEVVISFKHNFCDPRIAELAALGGFDCVWVCLEHIANDWSTVEAMVWAAKCHDVDTMVRIERGSYSDYIRPLEIDAAGIMVPHVLSLADAEAVVRMTRFQPLGRRPVDGGNADAAYTNVAFLDYLREANEQRFVVVQIEDPEALDELDAIAAVPGLDMLFFGPGDFSHGLGAPAVWDDPRLLAARRRVAEAALAHGKFAGTVSASADPAELIEMGYRFLNLGSDVTGLVNYCRTLTSDFAAAIAECGQ